MFPRPFTCCCAALAIASGFFLYTKKHQTTVLDQQISSIVQETEHVRAQTSMLRTEWALENQPERLAQLVARHTTNLHAMDPAQFVRMADLVQHLPAIAKTPAPEVAEPAAVAVVAENRVTHAAHEPAGPTVQTVASAAPVPARVAVVHERAPVLVADNTAPAARVSAPAAPLPAPVAAVAADTMPAPRAQPARRQLAERAPAQSDSRLENMLAELNDSEPASHAQAQQANIQQASVQPAAQRRKVAMATATTGVTPAVRTPSPTGVTSNAAYRVAQAGNTAGDTTAAIRHPLPASVASWHPARTSRTTIASGYMEARATSGYTGGSLLNRGGDSLPPPVPVTN
ncbi:hypothetical protein K2X14_14855 [Acetobacter sp. TBRC 12305]|uniref:Uncharacterized protein n=1 Tax=Acetobacter garciniae TaxID=2817435 RepID=A0A939HMP4_9PROT|nr:hypothetical protein [Acetobacter garciniae]MBO1326432.1 hypothetical protein [Acetobacter garciniae]MBX0346113.1 hypothetical protein [Acetobacter garciniae]